MSFAYALGWAILFAMQVCVAAVTLMGAGAVVVWLGIRHGWIKPGTTESTGPR